MLKSEGQCFDKLSMDGVGMMRLLITVCGLAALMLVATTAAASPREPFTINISANPGLGPVVLAVVDHGRAFYTGTYYCPDDENGDPGICTGNGINEGPVTIVRYLSNRPSAWENPGRRPLVRYVGQPRPRGETVGRRIAVLEQTGQGYLWQAFHLETSPGGWVCFPEALIAQLQITTRLTWQERFGERHCLKVSQLG